MDGLNPITRKEIYLAKVSGDQVETPEPITREEMYLKKIAEGGGGSGLPDTPGSNGYYTLMNAVLSGTPTVSWVKPLVVTVDDQTMTMSSTFKEIRDAFLHGRHVRVYQGLMGELYSSIISIYAYDESSIFRVVILAADGSTQRFKATSLNGYPQIENGFSGGDN